MINLYFCENSDFLKQEIKFDSTFTLINFDDPLLLSKILTKNFFLNEEKFFVYFEIFNFEKLLYIHSQIKHIDKKIVFSLPKPLSTKQIDQCILFGIKYIELMIDEITTLTFASQYCSTNGIRISPLLLQKLITVYNNDNTALINEIDKLAAYSNNNVTADVLKVFIHTKSENSIFDLLGLLLSEKNIEAHKLFDEIVCSGYSEIAIIETLFSQIRLLLQINALDNITATSMASILKINEYRIKKNITFMKQISKRNLFKMCENLATIDYNYKKGTLQTTSIKYELLI